MNLSAAEVRERLEAAASRSWPIDRLFHVWQERRSGLTTERIAERLAVSASAMNSVVRRLQHAGLFGPRQIDWSPARVELFRALWNDGHSIAEIASLLDITENAVIGKSHRMIAKGLIAARPRHAGNLSPEEKARRRAAAQPSELAHEKKMANQRKRRRSRPMEKRPRLSLSDAEREQRRAAAGARWEQSRTVPNESPVKRLVPTSLNQPLKFAPARKASAHVPPPKYGRIAQCCWPIGAPGKPEFHFCDKPTDPGRPYCRTHVGKAYVRVPTMTAQRARA